MFQRQKDLQLSFQDTPSPDAVLMSNVAIPRACSPAQVQNTISNQEEGWKAASAKLDRLLKFPTEQKNLYGATIDPRSSFYLRHRMVQSFLWLQGRRDQFPGKTELQLARLTANSFNRGGHTSRMIIQWTKSWIHENEIPNSHSGQHKHKFSWMDDEEVEFAVREFIRQQGESKYLYGYLL